MSDASWRPKADLSEYPRKPPVTFVDWFMLGLAIVSVVLLGWITFFRVDPEIERWVIRADYAVCAIFAAEFLLRWHRAGWPWKFPLIYWYEILGMIPLSDPAFRSFRLLRIIVVLARLARAADRAFGDRVTAALLSRSIKTVVDVVKRPITIAVLDEVGEVLKSGHYTQNIARALRENHTELDDMILELVKNDPQTKRLRYIPFHDDIVRLIADTSFRMIYEVLDDPRTDELVSDLLRENVEQIKLAVRGKYEAEPRSGAAAAVASAAVDAADRPDRSGPQAGSWAAAAARPAQIKKG